MLRLEPHGPDVWVGIGPQYPWGGLYGGQIVAQALRAAAESVDPRFRVHSLHAYFIRRGDHTEPIRFEVDRIRNGRSFVTRHVVARQAVGAILNLAASFQVEEPGTDEQAADLDPALPAPGDLPSDSWSELFDRRWACQGRPRGRTAAWMRAHADVGGDPVVGACTLAYLSDDLPADAVRTMHPDWTPGGDDDFMIASLDHSIWFHRRVPSGWQLHDLTCHGVIGSRGVAIGHVFAEDGTHLATVSQEVLVRLPRS